MTLAGLPGTYQCLCLSHPTGWQPHMDWKWGRENSNCIITDPIPQNQLWLVLPTPRFTCRIGLLSNRLPLVKKLLGRWPKIRLLFICLPLAAFFFKFANFLSIQSVFEPFQWSRTFFSSISGIMTSWRAININYLLYGEVNNLIVFLPNWVIFIISLLKSTQNLGNWSYEYLIKIGRFLSHLPWTKSQFAVA